MNEEKFTGKADLYEQFRPGYPDELIDFLYEKARCERVADIGAGTGKLTRCLLKKPWSVTAVEPNADMRAILEKMNGVKVVGAPAENTGFEDNSVGLVTAAQAFHWFDEDKFGAECRRILIKGGKVAIIFNERDYKDCEISKKRDLICMKFCGAFHTGHIGKRTSEEGDLFLRNEYFSNVEIFCCKNDMETDCAGFVGDTLSRSYALKKDDKDYGSFVEELKQAFSKYSYNGKVTVKYKTKCYLGTF